MKCVVSRIRAVSIFIILLHIPLREVFHHAEELPEHIVRLKQRFRTGRDPESIGKPLLPRDRYGAEYVEIVRHDTHRNIPGRQKFLPSAPELEPIYAICERFDKPVLFHAGLSWEPDTQTRLGHPLEFEAVAAAHPKLRICLGHFGWPWVRETAMLMLKYPNVYADTACLYFDSAREFYLQTFTRDIPATWIDRSLRHQVMFGSDNPRFEQIRMASALEELGLRDSTLELIRGRNALDFLGLAREGDPICT